ncbi:glycosyltransferase [Haloarcula marina]|uniref:glycosyltransferase n=1 Tax=Haloarcula marina TaxID=2961574 RepID=UPI0020B6653B|nr:glycosyltransferase [Halomicroarcula marina]
MIREPTVSVLLPVYNDSKFLEDAINSILHQSYENFEIVIVSEPSDDGTRSIIESYDDHRVRGIHNESRIGLNRSLNKGLDACRGQFVARMDADDLAAERRLSKQVQFLSSHPDIGIVGSFCDKINDNGNICGIYRVPKSDTAIRWCALTKNPFAHPAVMMRTSVLDEHDLRYQESKQQFAVEDYDLWIRALQYTKGWNIPEPLVKFRSTNDGVSARHKRRQRRNGDQVAYRAITNELPDFEISEQETHNLRRFLFGSLDPEIDPTAVLKIYFKLYNCFENKYAGGPGIQEAQQIACLSASEASVKSKNVRTFAHAVNNCLKLRKSFPIDFLSYTSALLKYRYGSRIRNQLI